MDAGGLPIEVGVGEVRVLTGPVGRRSGKWRRTWSDETGVGFWAWRRHGDVVLMMAELELAAWSTDGRKLWTVFVEPPWSYEVVGGRIRLEVMGEVRDFELRGGPAA